MSNKNLIKKASFDAVFAELCNQGHTPYIVVDTNQPNVFVPKGYADEQGFITLDISVKAVTNYHIDDNTITYYASFAGVRTLVGITYDSICSIYSKQDPTLGLIFPIYEADTPVEEVEPIKPTKSWADSAVVH